MQVSVIIPTYNEAAHVGCLVEHLLRYRNPYISEILVIDGDSQDDTVTIAAEAGARVHQVSCKGRAVQMNAGARMAKGDVLYFVHADTLPPASYAQDIAQAIQQGYRIGCFRARFDSNKVLLKINSYCTRFKRLMCRGGDQTLFIQKSFFEALNGYDEYYIVMEEYDLIRRACEQDKFKIMTSEVRVSARKYDRNSYLQVNFANLIVFTMFQLGFTPSKLKRTYQKLINYSV